MGIDQKYRWFFALMFLLSLVLGAYIITSYFATSRYVAHAFSGTNAADGINASDFTEADLAQSILQFSNNVMAVNIYYAKQNLNYLVVLSLLAIFHFVVGIVGLRATASPTQYLEGQNTGLKSDGLEPAV